MKHLCIMVAQAWRFTKMKIIVEILEKLYDEFGEVYYCPDNDNEKFEMKTGNKEKKIKDAKLKFNKLKSKLINGQRIRILEYHNDESDEIRKPCKVLTED